MIFVQIKKHDTSPALTLYAVDRVGRTVDLTGYVSAKFFMIKRGGTDLKVEGIATIVDPSEDGLLQYDWVDGDTDEDGVFFAEFEVEDADGKRRTFPLFGSIRVDVVGDLDDA